ncbi:probable E3 ubiquitin ligase SUD1 [Olea europaea var. sylvestris]|uniref:probable E3 ubiquitin ligase SUD1 n=1 Tax=Olea europaea var. sylvestris TaxID=158386 RepID=UPI000C1D60D5|nr:probable E3 ubiquitin ligase SUD1 [Olea europaea var. sylvestris]
MARDYGFSRLQGLLVLCKIVFPIILNLLTLLCVPCVRGVFYVIWVVPCWFANLHNSIHDDRYLIGRRLHNYRENLDEKQIDFCFVLEAQSSNVSDICTIKQNREVAYVGMMQRHLVRLDA